MVIFAGLVLGYVVDFPRFWFLRLRIAGSVGIVWCFCLVVWILAVALLLAFVV